MPLVEGATDDDAEKLDKFGKALQDNGYTPLDFTAENIAWASSTPGNVTADVTVHSQNPAMRRVHVPDGVQPAPAGGWQLSRTHGRHPADAQPESRHADALPTG